MKKIGFFKAVSILSKHAIQKMSKGIPETQSVITHDPPTNFIDGIFQDIFDGSKYPGSLSSVPTEQFVDYWTLRQRSMILFRDNPYCKGVIRRLLRNEINTGLNLESAPIESVLNISEETALEYAADREIDWQIWSETPALCDWNKIKTLTEIANDCRQTALISGDCLVVLRINSKTGLPTYDLIDGANIQTPITSSKTKNKDIKHGIEFNKKRQIAFWVRDGLLNSKRIPAFGEKSGRRIAWLVYGSERRLDEVRGMPILANMLYMMKELDRYRDSEQRAAVINSMLPMFIKRDVNAGLSTRVADTGAVRKDAKAVTQPDGSSKTWNLATWLPGMVPQTLAKGEEPVSFQTNRPNVNYQKFEEAIINVFSWTLEIPPEIVRLLFQNSFSASRQANNEFSIYLKFRFWKMGKDFYQPGYEEWTIQQALRGDIQNQALLDSWRNTKLWREFGAWVNAEWAGISRPSVDFKKDVDAGAKGIDYGLTTQDQQCRKLSGLPFKVVLSKRKREIEAAEKAGVSFASEEDQNRTPITQSGDGGNDDQNIEPNNIINARMNKLEKVILELSEKLEDFEEVSNA